MYVCMYICLLTVIGILQNHLTHLDDFILQQSRACKLTKEQV